MGTQCELHLVALIFENIRQWYCLWVGLCSLVIWNWFQGYVDTGQHRAWIEWYHSYHCIGLYLFISCTLATSWFRQPVPCPIWHHSLAHSLTQIAKRLDIYMYVCVCWVTSKTSFEQPGNFYLLSIVCEMSWAEVELGGWDKRWGTEGVFKEANLQNCTGPPNTHHPHLADMWPTSEYPKWILKAPEVFLQRKFNAWNELNFHGTIPPAVFFLFSFLSRELLEVDFWWLAWGFQLLQPTHISGVVGTDWSQLSAL